MKNKLDKIEPVDIEKLSDVVKLLLSNLIKIEKIPDYYQSNNIAYQSPLSNFLDIEAKKFNSCYDELMH